MDVLVLGGTRFFGVHLVEALLERGHRVTVATRGTHPDPFGGRVVRLGLDHLDGEGMRRALDGRRFDAVCDNISYCSNDVARLRDAVRAERFVVTSSGSVYELAKNRREPDFDPLREPPLWCERDAVDYSAGKRNVERALLQSADGSAAAVRFPYVVGLDDYTERLLFYIRHAVRGEPMWIDNPDAELSFVDSHWAGRFLAWLAEHPECVGAVNGASPGVVTLRQILEYVEKKTGKQACIRPGGEPAPYNGTPDYSLDVSRAADWGFVFPPLDGWIRELVDALLEAA